MVDAESKFSLRKIDEKRYALDARGFVCPYPQLLVMRALNALSSDEILEVTLDNPPSVRDIPPALEEKGYEVEVSRLKGSMWKLTIRTERC